MEKRIVLRPDRIQTREDMNLYMQGLFSFEGEHACSNLDALRDSLSEVTEDTVIVLTPETIQKICENEYSYKVLLALGYAAEENPHLSIRFREALKAYE